jgi:uncharacterized protein YggE
MSSATITLPRPGSGARWLALGLAGGLAGGLVLLGLGNPVQAPRPVLAADPSSPPDHTISVSGTGRIVIAPDLADLRFGVSVTRATVTEARAVAAASMASVIDALRKLGIAETDLKTALLSLGPVYDYSTAGKPRLTGYNLSNAVVVTIRDLDKVAAAIDGAIAAGATGMDGVVFRVGDPARAEEQARRSAMAQARAKAETLAASAGVAIDGVASIVEATSGMPYPVPYAAERSAAAPSDVSTPVQPGTNEVTVTVLVVYLIR